MLTISNSLISVVISLICLTLFIKCEQNETAKVVVDKIGNDKHLNLFPNPADSKMVYLLVKNGLTPYQALEIDPNFESSKTAMAELEKDKNYTPK